MEMPKFSVVVWTKDTDETYFRDLMDSMVSQNYENWELYVIDENPKGRYGIIVSEFFPEDDRVHYRQLKTNKGKAYAYNIGFHFVLVEAARIGLGDSKRDYIVVVNQHDRLSPNALSLMGEVVADSPDFIYTDHDEIQGTDRVSPHFKSGFNKELLMHRNYIGEFFAVSYDAARKLGEFQEKLKYAQVYEYLLRGVEHNMKFVRVPNLAYHQRKYLVTDKKEQKLFQEKQLKEHMLVAEASLKRRGISAIVEKSQDISYWKVEYDGADAFDHQKEFIMLRDKGVKPLTRHNVEKMYGILRQNDVAVVGTRFLKSGFTTENNGYIFDKDGILYPAFYDHKLYHPSYEHLASIPRDVSVVDFRYCMIDAKVYRKLGGLDPELSGRDVMLDFCLRAKKAGLRVVLDPTIIVRSKDKRYESTEVSNSRLQEKWGEVLEKGDELYNPNISMGLENYQIMYL